jgi:hypothetical protein
MPALRIDLADQIRQPNLSTISDLYQALPERVLKGRARFATAEVD